MVKPLHTGRAAENGWVAASLAAAGFTAAPSILEGDREFFIAGGGRYDENIIRNRMGAPWTFDAPGVGIKPFPSGALTHPAMLKMRGLVIEHSITPDQVARVVIKTNRLLPDNLTHHRPVTAVQGKFSMEFCLASILVLRRAGLAELTDDVDARVDEAKGSAAIPMNEVEVEENSASARHLPAGQKSAARKSCRRCTASRSWRQSAS